MQRLRIHSLILIVIFAFSAILTSIASAETPEILPKPTAERPLKFTSESLKGTTPTFTLTKEGSSLESEKLKNKGSFTTSNSGTIEVDFEGTKSPKGGASCNSKGDPKGIILLVNAPITLVDFKVGTVLELGATITVAPSPLIIECGAGLTIELKGAVLGKLDKVSNLVKTKVAELLLHQTKGEQALTKCELPTAMCSGKEFKLEGSVKGFELTGEETEDLITFAEEVEVHF